MPRGKPSSKQAQYNAESRARKRVVRSPAGAAKESAPAVEPYTPPTPAELAALESDCPAWLRAMMPEAYPLPFGDGHLQIIAGAVHAIETGESYAVVAPRGEGKSTTLQGVVLWAVATGRKRFPAYLPWSARDYKKALRFWKNQLCFNPGLAASYPELCAAFVACKGSSPKLAVLTDENGENWGARLQINEGMIILPHSLGAIGCATINGNPRGMNHATESGEVLRPDVGMIDDAQDKEVAKSAAQVRDVIEIINADIAGMSGPDRAMPLLLSGTIIAPNDVMTHYLDAWRSVRISQIVAWPKNAELWDEWNAARLAGEEQMDGGAAARAFYTEHRERLVEGMAVSWAERYDRKGGTPDAYYQAMLDYYRMGRAAFMAERQGEPEVVVSTVYDLPLDYVARRVNGCERLEGPIGASAVVGFCDINHDGIRWGLAAVTPTRNISIVDYGIYPGGNAMLYDPDKPQESEAIAVVRGLAALAPTLESAVVRCGEETLRPSLLMVDCGGRWSRQVVQWAESRSVWMASKGSGYARYRQTRVLRRGERWHKTRWQKQGDVVIHDADFWRLRQQRGWLLPGTVADAISLFGRQGQNHNVIAEGVVCERLTRYVETTDGAMYQWTMTPGMRNDFGDVCTGLYVAAAVSGADPTNTEGKGGNESKATAGEGGAAGSGTSAAFGGKSKARVRIGRGRWGGVFRA